MRSECPSPQLDCKYAGLPGGCFADTDHFYWPERNYQTPLEKEYRELPHHKKQLCRMLHDERHATEAPPTKPSREEMARAVASYVLKGVNSYG